MKLEHVKSDNGGMNLSFTLKDAGTAFANAIRRLSMGQVPVLAIDAITMYENNSAFFDEYIANRLGLMPIKTPDGYREGEDVLFKLSAEGPGVVYSKDLTSTERGVSCVSKKIPIIELVKDQRLRLEARARLGRGREHAKFQACLTSYGYDDKAKEFHFTVESFGQMSAAEVMLKTGEILQGKCEEFLEQLGKK
ncbi:DNA-directed RNA polymerase subunit D [Candidatus Burarchaeum australiense]|nr:DNA-directed RNA polymerase subunit D [Candidatus Burarchaeum australiense]